MNSAPSSKPVDPHSVNEPQLPPEKWYYLQRTQVLEECKRELLNWGKARFWTIALIIAVVGLVGGFVIIRQEIKTAVDHKVDHFMQPVQDSTIAAKVFLAKSELTLDEATQSLSGLDKHLQNSRRNLEMLSDRYLEIDQQFLALKESFRASSTNAAAEMRHEINRISDQLASVDTVLYGITESSDTSKSFLEEHKKHTDELSSIAKLENARFADNSAYSVSIYYDSDLEETAVRTESKLANDGYRVSAIPIRYLHEARIIVDATKQEKLVTITRTIPTLPEAIQPGEWLIAYSAAAGDKVQEVISRFSQSQEFKLVELDRDLGAKQWLDTSRHIEAYLTVEKDQ